jgi:hypothetical protein
MGRITKNARLGRHYKIKKKRYKMKFIWILLKVIGKVWLIGFGLVVIGIILESLDLMDTESDTVKAILGLVISIYFILAILWLFKPNLFRKKKVSPNIPKTSLENDDGFKTWLMEVSSGKTENLNISKLVDEKVEEEDTAEEDTAEEDTAEEDTAEGSPPNFEPLMTQLTREEKFILMVGLLALHGDGDLSHKEIFQLRKTISEIKFKPPGLIHRDPSDKTLCLDEKLVWALTLIRRDFGDSPDFTDKDITKLFNTLTASIEVDIKKTIADETKQQIYSERLKQALIDIANADGVVSKRESELMKSFVDTSEFHSEKLGVIGYVLLGAIGFGSYKLITWFL